MAEGDTVRHSWDMRELVKLVFIIKNSLAQSWNAFVLKYAAAATKVQQAKQREAGEEKQRERERVRCRLKRCNKNVCIMIITTIN